MQLHPAPWPQHLVSSGRGAPTCGVHLVQQLLLQLRAGPQVPVLPSPSPHRRGLRCMRRAAPLPLLLALPRLLAPARGQLVAAAVVLAVCSAGCRTVGGHGSIKRGIGGLSVPIPCTDRDSECDLGFLGDHQPQSGNANMHCASRPSCPSVHPGSGASTDPITYLTPTPPPRSPAPPPQSCPQFLQHRCRSGHRRPGVLPPGVAHGWHR